MEGFILNDLLDKPWSQASSLLHLFSRMGFSAFPLLLDFHRFPLIFLLFLIRFNFLAPRGGGFTHLDRPWSQVPPLLPPLCTPSFFLACVVQHSRYSSSFFGLSNYCIFFACGVQRFLCSSSFIGFQLVFSHNWRRNDIGKQPNLRYAWSFWSPNQMHTGLIPYKP